jgi:cell division protein YceG involved in septum cleavage
LNNTDIKKILIILLGYKDYVRKSNFEYFLIYNNNVNEIKYGDTEMQSVNEILSELENADNTTKNKLENELVSIGTSALPELVDQLQVVRGIKRGVVAMTLIRLGDASVKYLEKAAHENKDFEWVAEYLIREIKGIAA